MKKGLIGGCLAVCILFGLTGCSEQIVEDAANTLLMMESESFTTGKAYMDDTISITVETAFLSDCAMAPLTESEDGSVCGYFAAEEDASEENGDYLYLDCISTVTNVSDEAIDLEEDLYFYCAADEELYESYMLLTESEDGTELLSPELLESGDTARVHYIILLPADVSWDAVKVHFLMPGGENSYTEPLSNLLPTCDAFAEGDSLTSETGAVLTLKSVEIVDEVAAVAEGGNAIIQPSTTGNKLANIIIEVQNNGTESVTLGTLYGGLWISDTFGSLGSVMLETDDAMVYAGEIEPGSTVTTHMIYELGYAPAEEDSCYLYLDGTYYSIEVK